YRRIMTCIDRFDRFGLITHDQKHPGAHNKFQSRFCASPEIRVLPELEPPPPIRHDRMRQPIILRDEDKVSIGFTENRVTARQRRIIAIMQEARNGVAIDLAAEAPCVSRRADHVWLSDKNGDAYGVWLQDRPLFAVFSRCSWDLAGRKYGPAAQ